MSLKRVELLNLFLGGLSHLQCREMCESHAGYKLSRVNLHEAQLEIVRSWCRRHGLACELSDFAVIDNPLDEGKGAWRNTGRCVPDGAPTRFCYVSRSTRDARTAKRIEAGSEANHRTLGALLKIPECCTEFYLRHREEAVTHHADDYVMLTTRATGPMPSFSWKVNYLAQYFGFSLIHHYPCRWDCAATLGRAQAALKILESISPRWLATFRRNMKGVVVVEGMSAVHLIAGELRGSSVAVGPGQVRSTVTTPLIVSLSEKGSLTWASPFEVDGAHPPPGDHDALAGKTAVIPFA